MMQAGRILVLSVLIALVVAQQCGYQAPANPEDRRLDKSTLIVATYNAEWLFLSNTQSDENPNVPPPPDHPAPCPPAGCMYDTYSEALSHLEAVAAEISYINPDIIVLEEVESCSTLDVLNEKIGSSFGYRPYLIQGTDSYTGQNVGLLTKIDPIVNLQRSSKYVDYPVPGNKCGASVSGDTGVSKHLYTAFDISGTTYHIFGMHLLAYPDDKERCLEREAQATVIAEFMASKVTSKNDKVIVLGDLNDFAPNMPDAAGSVPISRTLEFLYDGLLDVYDEQMVNVGIFDPQQFRYSAWWDKNYDCVSEPGELTAIDHMIVSPNLWDNLIEMAYYHNYAATCETAVSDHFAVVASFFTD